MRVVVTGGTGFVGTRVVSLLKTHLFETIVISAHPPKLPISGVTYYTCDLSVSAEVTKIQNKVGKIDTLIHLAGRIPGAVSEVEEGKDAYTQANEHSTQNILNAFKNNVSHVIYASTIDVYGLPQSEEYREGQTPAPLNDYATTKLAGEIQVQTFSEAEKIPWTILRLSQVYGPGDIEAKAIPRFIANLKKGLSIGLHGNGTDKRRYIYVDDVAHAFLCATEQKATGIFNIAGEDIVDTLTVINALQKVLDRPLTIERSPGKLAGDRIMSIELAREKLHFIPKTSLETGLSLYCKAEGLI